MEEVGWYHSPLLQFLLGCCQLCRGGGALVALGWRGSVLLQPPGRSEQRSECSRAGSPVLGWTTVSEGKAAGRGAILYLHFKWVFHVKLIYMYVYVCVYINNVNFRIGSNAYTGLKFAW